MVLLLLLLLACFSFPVIDGITGGVTVCHEFDEDWEFCFLLNVFVVPLYEL